GFVLFAKPNKPIWPVLVTPSDFFGLSALRPRYARPALRKPEKSESTEEVIHRPPAASEAVPAVSEVVPAVSEAVPAVSEAVPAVSEAVPAVSEVVPAVSEAVPSVSEAVPSAPEKTLRIKARGAFGSQDISRSGSGCMGGMFIP